jgi:hypothetical protein
MHTARIILGVFALSLVAVGCDDSSNNNNSPDLAMSTGADLSASGQTCNQVITCAAGCAGVATCIQACAAKGSTAAMSKFNALNSCAVGVCLQASDAGAAKCSSATDTSAGCVACAQAAAQSASCATQLAACTSG